MSGHLMPGHPPGRRRLLKEPPRTRGNRIRYKDSSKTSLLERAEGGLQQSSESRMIGEIISKYRVIEKIGQGGMGVVYRAEDLRLRRHVALKLIAPELTRDPQARSRFLQEAQTISSFEHPNICVVHEVDETPDGRMFMAMTYYAGETLREKIARGPLALDQALDIAAQVARGLGRAHEQGIVHRDAKPANILAPDRG